MGLNKNTLIILGLGVLVGIAGCYISLQYSFFEIEWKINVVESLIALARILVGVFIAVNLRKWVSQQTNSYNFVMQHFNELWGEYKGFEKNVLSQSRVQVSLMANKYKEIELMREKLVKVLSLTQVNEKYLTKIEDEFEAMNDLIEQQPTADNLYDLEGIKLVLKGQTTNLSNHFIALFNDINQKLS